MHKIIIKRLQSSRLFLEDFTTEMEDIGVPNLIGTENTFYY